MTAQPPAPPTAPADALAEARALRARGALHRAREVLETALAQAPAQTSVALELGQVLLELKRPMEAAAVFERQIAHAPGEATLRLGLGTALLEAGEPGRAAAVLLKASRLDPALLAPRLLLARALTVLGRGAEALSVLEQTAAAFPDAAEVWAQLGAAQRALQRHAAAEASFRRQLALSPDDAHALNNLGVALRAQGRLAAAAEAYRAALARAPGLALAHANLGNALDALGETAAAETHLRAAAELAPASADARYNLGAHLVRTEQADEAVAHLRFVAAAAPERWDAWTNLGVALTALGETEEAERCCRRAIALRPDAPEAHYNLAWLLLLTGRWTEGWREYEWRWQLPHFSSIRRHGAVPAWDGTPRPGATIVLHAEQGLGDAIQFARLAAAVRERCGRVILDCHPGLTTLLGTVAGVDTVVAFGTALPPHDAHAYLPGLARLLGLTPESVPGAAGYLRAPAPRAGLRLAPTGRRRVGIVWVGSPDNKIDRRRSCDPALFAELLRDLDVEAVSLQTGAAAAHAPPTTFAINGVVQDWADTAAVVAQLDLVIGVDTGVMHLTGALGRPGWLLLPFSPDFRWLLGRADTPWYRSIRLFRQPRPGDWPAVFAAVRAALTDWLRTAS